MDDWIRCRLQARFRKKVAKNCKKGHKLTKNWPFRPKVSKGGPDEKNNFLFRINARFHVQRRGFFGENGFRPRVRWVSDHFLWKKHRNRKLAVRTRKRCPGNFLTAPNDVKSAVTLDIFLLWKKINYFRWAGCVEVRVWGLCVCLPTPPYKCRFNRSPLKIISILPT